MAEDRSPDGVFVCYRHDDTEAEAWRLVEHLRRSTKRPVFIDTGSLSAGAVFAEDIRKGIKESSVLVAVIGPNWLTAVDETGSRRLDDPEDFVRKEIEDALNGSKRVVPLLVRDARMPTAAELPQGIRGLSERHALRVRNHRFETDLEELVRLLRKRGSRRWFQVVLATATAALACLALVHWAPWIRGSTDPSKEGRPGFSRPVEFAPDEPGLYLVRGVARGEVIEEDLLVAGPASTGPPPDRPLSYALHVRGARAARDLPRHKRLEWSDLAIR